MLSIICPDDDGEDTYRKAARRTRNRDLRQELLAQAASVGARVAEYLELAEDEELFRLATEARGALGAEMARIYDRVLVRGAGRPLYNRIKGSAKYARCPFCGQRDVKTVDHYLPKQRYPEFAVFAANLIPCCSDCNKAKGEHLAGVRAAQIFHPYFDDWSMHRIVHANVAVGDKVDVTFEVRPVPGLSPETLARARTHFELLELGRLYSAGAAVELVENKAMFRRNFQMGAVALRTELSYIAQSRQGANLNSWRAALYWGLAESEDFCGGGFERIEE
jgi:hypothetical protein